MSKLPSLRYKSPILGETKWGKVLHLNKLPLVAPNP